MATRAQIQRWRALHRREGRAEQRAFLAEGVRVVEEAGRQGVRPRAVGWCAARCGERELRCLESLPASVERVELRRDELERVADARTPQGLLAVYDLPSSGLAELRPAARTLVLDGVSDPGNVGTLLRSALAFGFGRVLLDEECADPWSPKVVRSTAGALFGLQIARAPGDALRSFLGAQRIPWAVASAGSPDRLAEAAARPCVALIVGAEGRGVAPPWLEGATWTVSVAQSGEVESLNAAVAGSILMDRFVRGAPRAG